MYIRIKKVQKGKLAFISALTVTVISLAFYPIMLWPMFTMDYGLADLNMGLDFYRIFMLGLPVFYFIIGYIGSYIFLALFNVITSKTGGFKVELFEIENEEERDKNDQRPYGD